MRKTWLNVLSFAVMIVLLITVLKVMNWVPMAVQKGLMKRYSSVEEVKTKLNIRDLHVPSYFPQKVAWPPSEILAQSRPFLAVVMEFHRAGKGDTVLVIVQSQSRDFSPGKKIKIIRTREKVRYPLKGREAVLEVGTCKNEEPCSTISWDEGKYRIQVTMKSPPFELIKIAESMIN
jgi:hypothetical protein